MRTCLTLALAGLVALFSFSAPAADWPAWRGPNRDAVSPETGLLATWPEGGPKLLWQSDKAGLGYAGLAVVGGTSYTMGVRGADEYLIAFDAKGQETYATKIGPTLDWNGNSWSRGPNATPTVAGDHVYALSSRGALLCASKADGKVVWKLDLVNDLDGQVNPVGGGFEQGKEILGWGYSWSPLVEGDQLILTPGGPKGLFAGVDLKTGKVLWRSKDVPDQATYSSPVAATLAGTRQYVAITQDSVVGVSAKDGALLWRHKREEPYPDVVCPTPIIHGDTVYISVGYNAGSDLLKISGGGGKFKAEVAWSEKVIGNKQGGVVLLKGAVYGFHEDRVWAAQDVATGKTLWPKNQRMRQSVKSGGLLAADGRLYVMDETGTVAMLEASPTAFKVISQFKLPTESKNRKARGGLWTHPVLSDGKLYLRDQELVYCYAVK